MEHTENKNQKMTGAATAAGRSAYETKVGVEAVARSGGNNPQLKGVVHEILYRDSLAVDPTNLVTGAKPTLSQSVTAVRDDVLVKQGGDVVFRAQLKDTVSASGVRKTVEQVVSGKYAGTNLMGTEEAAAAYSQAVERLAQSGTKVTQKMTSTGISSADTSRIAAQTIGGTLEAASVAKAAFSSGGVGAAFSGGIAAITSGVKLAQGDIDGEEFVGTVAKETIGGGLSAAAGSAAATATAAAAATVLASTTAPLWVPGALAVGAALAVGSGIKSFWDFLFD
jgi:hypothetical protein